MLRAWLCGCSSAWWQKGTVPWGPVILWWLMCLWRLSDLSLGSSVREGDLTPPQAQTWTLPSIASSPPALWKVPRGGAALRHFPEMLFQFRTQESLPVSCSKAPLSQQLGARVCMKTWRVCFCCHLLSAGGNACGVLAEESCLAHGATHHPLPSTEGEIKMKLLVSPSENSIMKTCVYWPSIILKQHHLNCDQTAKWPFCPPAQHPWKGLLFLWFNEETFCLVKQVFFQSCLLVSYRKIIVGSWFLLSFFIILIPPPPYPLNCPPPPHPPCSFLYFFFFFFAKEENIRRWAASWACKGPQSYFSVPDVSCLLFTPPPRVWEPSRVSEASTWEWSTEYPPVNQGRQSWLMCLYMVCFSVLQLFVGLGFPYEGPAPLEAIANGCAFLNPKFSPPKSSKNTDFFIGKPTLREVSVYKKSSYFQQYEY